MPTCSRCGATDNLHSIKCLKANALAVAMGAERPFRPVDSTLTAYGQDFVERGRDVAQLREQIRQLEVLVAQLREGRDRYRTAAYKTREELDALRARDAWDAGMAPVTQLPPDYYTSRLAHPTDPPGVSPQRLAEIAEEVRQLNESPHLDVKIHSPVDATVTRREDEARELRERHVPVGEGYRALDRDDDYTEAAIVRTEDQDLAETAESLGEALDTGRPVEVMDFTKPEAVAGTRIPGVAGSWAQPETLATERAVKEFARRYVVAAEGKRTDDNGREHDAYITASEALAAFEAWAKGRGITVVKTAQRMLGTALAAHPDLKKKRQGPVHNGGKPQVYVGLALADTPMPAAAPEPAPAAPAEPAPTPLTAKQQTEQIRALMAAAREQATAIEERHEDAPAPVEPGPDELATKLAQLKVHGIGGKHGVEKAAARTAVEDLHPTGRDVWKQTHGEGVTDAELDATGYQLLVKCMDGLPESVVYKISDEVRAVSGFSEESVESVLRNPQRVEMRPESWSIEKRYPVLGFTRGDVQVILGMRNPENPMVIAAYWTSLLQADKHVVNHTGGGGSKRSVGLPTTPSAAISRLRDAGCTIDEPDDEKPVKVTYKDQDLGKITTARTTPKITVQSDYQRTLRKMQAIDRRETAKAG